MTEEKRKTSVFAPEYYNEFKCVAGNCKHSCCIDWEICIDEEALEKYRKMKDVWKTVKKNGDEHCFVLSADGRCPHLNADGLCDIIISHGEDSLCEICKNHPRFFNCFGKEKIEAGLGAVCEEACRLILQNQKTFSLVKVDEFEEDGFFDEEETFDATSGRQRAISIIEEKGDFEKKLRKLKSQFEIPKIKSPKKWLEFFLELEILNEEWKVCLRSVSPSFGKVFQSANEKFDKYYENLLVYFIFRHVSVSESEVEFRSRLAFAILSAQMIKWLFEDFLKGNYAISEEKKFKKLVDVARAYSAEIEYSEENTEELIFAFESERL